MQKAEITPYFRLSGTAVTTLRRSVWTLEGSVRTLEGAGAGSCRRVAVRPVGIGESKETNSWIYVTDENLAGTNDHSACSASTGGYGVLSNHWRTDPGPGSSRRSMTWCWSTTRMRACLTMATSRATRHRYTNRSIRTSRDGCLLRHMSIHSTARIVTISDVM